MINNNWVRWTCASDGLAHLEFSYFWTCLHLFVKNSLVKKNFLSFTKNAELYRGKDFDVKHTCKSLFLKYNVILNNYSWGRPLTQFFPAKRAPFNWNLKRSYIPIPHRPRIARIAKNWFLLIRGGGGDSWGFIIFLSPIVMLFESVPIQIRCRYEYSVESAKFGWNRAWIHYD